MTKNEIELIKMIRESNCPERSILTAIEIISEYVEQHESVQVPRVVCLQESF